MALGQIIPTAINYQTRLLENVKGIKEIFGEKEYKTLSHARLELIKQISDHITAIKEKVYNMTEARKVANRIENDHDKALRYSKTVLPFLDDIRYHIDHLEQIVDNEEWPLPKYRELLFTR